MPDGEFDWGGRLRKGIGGAQRFPQNGRKPFEECKGRRELDCDTDGWSRYESIGVQSARDSQLKTLGRPHTAKQARAAFAAARRAGFENIRANHSKKNVRVSCL